MMVEEQVICICSQGCPAQMFVQGWTLLCRCIAECPVLAETLCLLQRAALVWVCHTQ